MELKDFNEIVSGYDFEKVEIEKMNIVKMFK